MSKSVSIFKKTRSILNQAKDTSATEIRLAEVSKPQATAIKTLIAVSYAVLHNRDLGEHDPEIRFDELSFEHVEMKTHGGAQHHVTMTWDEESNMCTIKFPEQLKPFQMIEELNDLENVLFRGAHVHSLNISGAGPEDVYVIAFHSKNELMAGAVVVAGLMGAHNMNHHSEMAIASENDPPCMIIRKQAYESLCKKEIGRNPGPPLPN